MPTSKKPAAKPAATRGKISVETYEDLTTLTQWLESSGLAEIAIEQGDTLVHLKRPQAGVTMAPAVASPAPQPQAESNTQPTQASQNTFKSPMVGTFYTASSPESAAFVQVGQTVKEGQVICIIEAMKTMNQIESDRAGTIKKVLVDNATPVEYGQPLFEIG